MAGEAIKPGDAGSHYVELTDSSISADQFAGGYFCTTDDSGEGYTYRIKGNTATDDPVSGNIRLELYEPLQVAVDQTTDYAIQGSPFNDCVACTHDTDLVVAGVACANNAAGSFGWVQTRGVCAIATDSTTISAGDSVSISATGDGYVSAWGANGTDAGSGPALMIAEQLLGTCLIPGDGTGHGVYNLTMLE